MFLSFSKPCGMCKEETQIYARPETKIRVNQVKNGESRYTNVNQKLCKYESRTIQKNMN